SESGLDSARGELIDPGIVVGLEDWAEKTSGMALAVKRFDRDDESGIRTHMEELAQVLNISTGVAEAKYRSANFETIAVFVANLSGVQDVGEVIDRVVLSVLVGNGDAHLKNWAFIYPDGVTPKLSPMYDVVPTVLYLRDDNIGLNLDKSKVFETITPRSFERIGDRSGFGATNARTRAAEATERILEKWNLLKDYLSREAFIELTARLDRLRLTKK
ncbi:MAG TPA: HipA domain-containing protein, partial [Nonomuraea sp.]|nr:HipA domain-containing protein [Nonomuraea sp.]